MQEIIELINEMSPYILLGFLLAGLMHAFIPHTLYRRYVGKNNFRSILNAALLGVPLPLCSCGVIPTAMSLRKEGASKGATVSFLIATPQTGIDSIIATYSLMGLPFAILRPVTALVTALLGGLLVCKFDNTLAHMTDTNTILSPQPFQEGYTTFTKKCLFALKYAFIDMMQDIGRWLVLGLFIAGLITVLVPDSFFSIFADKPLASMMLVLLFAVPMYLCATGSIPIAVALMLKGLSPGTALVLLMAGPAVNVASMLVISKVMGRRTLLLYLCSIVCGAICFGLTADYLLPRKWFTESLTSIQTCCYSNTPYFNIACSILLFCLLGHALFLRYLARKRNSSHHTDATDPKKEIVIYVEGMSCNHCKNNVEKVIRQITGVEDVIVDLQSGATTIKGSPSHKEVTQAIESIGFSVKQGIV